MAIELISTDKSEIAASIEKAKRDIDSMIDMVKLVARLRYESYKAHIDQGFTSEQALELCKKWN